MSNEQTRITEEQAEQVITRAVQLFSDKSFNPSSEKHLAQQKSSHAFRVLFSVNAALQELGLPVMESGFSTDPVNGSTFIKMLTETDKRREQTNMPWPPTIEQMNLIVALAIHTYKNHPNNPGVPEAVWKTRGSRIGFCICSAIKRIMGFIPGADEHTDRLMHITAISLGGFTGEQINSPREDGE